VPTDGVSLFGVLCFEKVPDNANALTTVLNQEKDEVLIDARQSYTAMHV
jgi:hypothetical protein